MDYKELMAKEGKAARDIAAKAEAEARDLSGEEMASIKSHIDAYNAAKSQLASINAVKGLGDVETKTEEVRPSGLIVPSDNETVGDAFVKSAEYTEFVKTLPKSTSARHAIQINMNPVGVKSLVTGLSSTSAGAFVVNDRLSIFERLGRADLRMRDLVTKGSTQSDTVEYVRETSNTNAAAYVAEATTDALPTQSASTGPLVNNAGGGYKPQGAFAFAVVTEVVKTLAEWMPATNRSLADAGQMRTLIDQKLRDDLKDVEDNQILNGDGSGENLRGILQVSGIQNALLAPSGVLGANSALNYIEQIKRAKTAIRITGRANASAVVMNPVDAQDLYFARIEKNPAIDGSTDGNLPVAGLPIIESENIAVGHALVGDFSKSILWDREAATLSVTNSHADFFIRNLVAVLAEQREAFGVTRPLAFYDVTLDKTP